MEPSDASKIISKCNISAFLLCIPNLKYTHAGIHDNVHIENNIPESQRPCNITIPNKKIL